MLIGANCRALILQNCHDVLMGANCKQLFVVVLNRGSFKRHNVFPQNEVSQSDFSHTNSGFLRVKAKFKMF